MNNGVRWLIVILICTATLGDHDALSYIPMPKSTQISPFGAPDREL